FATFSEFWRKPVALAAAVFMAFMMSVDVELVQLVIVSRFGSMVDISANTLGAMLGAGAAWIWRSHHHANRFPMRADAMFVAACWVLYQLFPFLPHRGGPRLVLTWRLLDGLAMFAAIIGLAPVVYALGGTVRRRRLTLVALAALILLRIFIYTR